MELVKPGREQMCFVREFLTDASEEGAGSYSRGVACEVGTPELDETSSMVVHLNDMRRGHVRPAQLFEQLVDRGGHNGQITELRV